jgi:hypothetical protein
MLASSVQAEDGKEVVDGSSPSQGFPFSRSARVPFRRVGNRGLVQRPRDVHRVRTEYSITRRLIRPSERLRDRFGDRAAALA